MSLITCDKCGKAMDEGQFYTYRDGTKTELCKKCLTLHIDNFNPDTYVWLLQKMDVPYIPEEWNVLRDKAYAKNPNTMNGMSVFGKYLSKMKLNQWKDKTWEDSEKLQAESIEKNAKKKEEREANEAELKKQYEEGKISEAQYKTLMSAETQYRDMMNSQQLVDPSSLIGNNNPFNETNFIDPSELPDPAAELTKEDKIYLALKWGREYRPNEWIEMEKKYTEMKESFDIQDSDTEGTLILICKTFLKMNQAIDMNDMEGYQKLSKVYDALRKSSKFTAAQNKEQKEEFVDSVGELVAYCEKNGGAIPKFEITTPLDIVDKVINDLKSYNKSLIYEDTALARQIEDYLKARENAEKAKRDREEASKAGMDFVPIEDTDFEEYKENIENEKLEDQKLVKGETK